MFDNLISAFAENGLLCCRLLFYILTLIITTDTRQNLSTTNLRLSYVSNRQLIKEGFGVFPEAIAPKLLKHQWPQSGAYKLKNKRFKFFNLIILHIGDYFGNFVPEFLNLYAL